MRPAPRTATAIAISPDGRTAAFSAPRNLSRIDFVDLQSGAITVKKLPWPYRAAATWDPSSIQWFGRDLVITVNTGGSVDPVSLIEPASSTGHFQHLNTLPGIWYPWFFGTYQNQPAALIPSYTTDVRSLPNLKSIGHLDFPVRGLRDGWMLPLPPLAGLRTPWPFLHGLGRSARPHRCPPRLAQNARSPAALLQSTAIDILGPDQKPVATINADALKTAFPRGVRDAEAQLSPDHRRLLLAPESHGPWIGNQRGEIFPMYPWGWAVFDAATGQYVYGEKQDTVIVSRLALTNDGVYCIAWATTQSPSLPLPSQPLRTARPANHFFFYQSTGELASAPLQLPIDSPGPDFNGPFAPFTTAMSPAGDFLLLYTLDPNPHLLKIPLRPNIQPQELSTIPLPPPQP